jgi:putative acetyltransferase
LPDSGKLLTEAVAIRPFRLGDEAAFRQLNEEWIKRFFRIEEKDEATFAHPAQTIIGRGGQILMAIVGGEAVGCCALLRTAESEFEVGKMAVSPRHQGAGIGKRLLLAAIDAGLQAGADRLYLETNHALTPAICLYESVGFKHLDPTRVEPSRYARADVYMEMFLG